MLYSSLCQKVYKIDFINFLRYLPRNKKTILYTPVIKNCSENVRL